MTAVVVLLLAVAGVGTLSGGARLWFIGRFRQRSSSRRRWGRRMVGLGGLVAGLGPVLVAASSGAAAGLDILAAIWASLVGAITIVALLATYLGSERMAIAARAVAHRAAQRVPSPRLLTGRSAATNGLPRDWDGLIELDRSLGRRLVWYASVDAGSAHPVMTDPTDPATRAAVEAMLRCDELRTPASPRPWSDIRASAYAGAVADFRDALTAAEANSIRINRVAVTPAERTVIERATRQLAYLREQATTASERRSVYDALVLEFKALDTPSEESRTHPWLDVDQRAQR